MRINSSKASITIKDIADMCDVSISTVSNVINGKNNKVSPEVAQKIRDTVEKTGYKPNYLAKNLRAASTKTIGIIAEDLVIFSASPMIEGVMNCCEENGYNVIIENLRLFGRWSDKWMNDDSLFQSALSPVLSKLSALHVNGIIYIGGHEHVVKHFEAPDNLPIVMAYSIPDDKSIPSFRLDDFQGGYDAISHLLSLGHKKIGVIAGEPGNTHTINRVNGVQKAMYDAGILFDPENIVYEHWSKEGGYAGMKNLEHKDISAVFCMADQIAAGAYQYLYERNLIPGKDISIVGYDNQSVSSLITPALTTVALPLPEIGYKSAKRLLDIISGADPEDSATDIRIKGSLIERDSTHSI